METCFVSQSQMQQAFKTLHKFSEEKKSSNLLKSLDENELIFLQVINKKIFKTRKAIRIKLPHTLIEEKSDVCLFVRDVNKTRGVREFEPTTKHFMDFLTQSRVASVTEVIPLKQLKLEYMPYEAKRALCTRFRVFLSDTRIVRLLPKLLGREFYQRKMLPRPVNLNAKDVASEISDVLSSTYLYMSGRGSTSTVAVGHTGMTSQQLQENVESACSRLAEALPGGLANLRVLNIKTELSPSLPLYLDTGDAKSIDLPKIKTESLMCEPEEVDTLMGAQVAVTKDGEVIVVDKRHRSLTKRVKEAKTKIQRTKRYQQYLEKRKEVKITAVTKPPPIKPSPKSLRRRNRKHLQKEKKKGVEKSEKILKKQKLAAKK